VTIAIPLGTIYQSVSAAAALATGNDIDLSQLAQDAFSHELVPYNASTFLVVTRAGQVSSNSYTFVFAVQATANHPPVINVPSTLAAGRDETVSLPLDVSDPDNDTFTLRTDSPVATVEGTTLKVHASAAGDYPVIITAEDSRHATAQAMIEVQVT
jgi:hypothetical protein